jgi:GTP pyrophosphokinase
MSSVSSYFTTINKLRGKPLNTNERKLVGSAYALAEQAHEGQKRANGEPYFSGHCVPVSYNVASLGMDADMIAAALLHDTLEDTTVTHQEVEAATNRDVADMVEAVSKLSKIKYHGNERHVESLRKFFVASAKDARVVVLKLCDRWHNLETLVYLPEAKRQRIARESILIHAQLASRMAMGNLAVLLKDLAFPFAYPEKYEHTRIVIERALNVASKIIESMYRQLHIVSHESLGYTPKVDKRIKSLYSAYRKLERKDWDVTQLYDLVALRIIVKNVEDCYKLLGAIHQRWQPMPGRMKDYIALPKPNGYRSLHTTVLSGSGLAVEIQIRTESMHSFNEYGIASHHGYKNRQAGERRETFDWMSQLLELNSARLSSDEYIRELESDFFQDRIFALTPRGDVIDLPAGGTILDFAYAVHSDIGDSAQGGVMNGKYCALNTPIVSESVIEIVRNPKGRPSKKWLEWVKTSHARTKIRKNLSEQRRGISRVVAKIRRTKSPLV